MSAAQPTAKLGVYFAERERVDAGFLADALLDRFAEHRVADSIMLRGVASFGLHNIARTDESLTLSEDLPVLISAVDEASVVEALVAGIAPLTGRALVTVERAVAAGGTQGLVSGPVKLNLYLRRQQRVGRTPAYQVVCAVLHRLGFVSATAFLGVDGIAAGQRRRGRFFSRNAEVPMVVTAVGTPAQVALATAELADVLAGTLQTAQPVQVCKRDGRVLSPPAGTGDFQQMTVWSAEDNHDDGAPIHRLLVRALREGRHVSGATVLRGLWGFQNGQPPRGDTMARLSRRVPVATVVIDTPARVARAFEIADTLTARHGLIICEDVEVHGP
ncbi:DUF190 domain-containing protein [Mycobacterium sp. ACS4331]|uniref:DUF190 domain-containing protein n=1 Tax=Mycobacterium sp. ACS4331 TaxID=1834121 RepID=UPI0008023082|nr:DUF190 domain-containing protein [Mycobacterium sp. ACS4331]OBF21587.1 hypothetical protein A5727_08690 [Mycobacterium sp. ACS4331]